MYKIAITKLFDTVHYEHYSNAFLSKFQRDIFFFIGMYIQVKRIFDQKKKKKIKLGLLLISY